MWQVIPSYFAHHKYTKSHKSPKKMSRSFVKILRVKFVKACSFDFDSTVLAYLALLKYTSWKLLKPQNCLYIKYKSHQCTDVENDPLESGALFSVKMWSIFNFRKVKVLKLKISCFKLLVSNFSFFVVVLNITAQQLSKRAVFKSYQFWRNSALKIANHDLEKGRFPRPRRNQT